MKTDQIEIAAQNLLKARLNRYQIDSLPTECVPTTVDEAYAIQDRLHNLLDESVAGWFLGCTNDEALERLNANGPYSARLFKKDLFEAPIQFAHDHFFDIWIDCEFAFELAYDLPTRSISYKPEEIMDAVISVYPAIEVVNGYLRNWQQQPIGAIMADNGTDGALILGSACHRDCAKELREVQVTAYRNGKIAATGSGADVLGDPWITMTWLANEQSRRGHGLKAGNINNTGSCTKPFHATIGDTIVVDYASLGRVEVKF